MRTSAGTLIATVVAALSTTACGNNDVAPASDSGAMASASSVTAAVTSIAGARASKSPLAARGGELLNPDDSVVVLLYYDLAGIAAPLDGWVEEDSRVRVAPALDKAAKRNAVRAELASAAAGVRDVGTIRLTMNANLSEYDPAYEEFTVRALAPSSIVSFDALGQKVSLRFANGNDAQVWRVSKADAQAVRDRIGYSGASLDVLLKITPVQPGPAGGTIVTNVMEYELREKRSGVTLARVRVDNE